MGKEIQNPDHAMPNVSVIKIMANRNDPTSPNKTLQLRWETNKVGGDGVLNMFLKGGIDQVEHRVALQVIHDDHIKDYKLEVGSMINDVLPTPVRLTVEEINVVDYHNILNGENPENAKSYSIKQNPTNGKYMLDNDGDYIYRTVKVTGVEAIDQYIIAKNSTIEAPEGVINELVENLQS